MAPASRPSALSLSQLPRTQTHESLPVHLVLQCVRDRGGAHCIPGQVQPHLQRHDGNRQQRIETPSRFPSGLKNCHVQHCLMGPRAGMARLAISSVCIDAHAASELSCSVQTLPSLAQDVAFTSRTCTARGERARAALLTKTDLMTPSTVHPRTVAFWT